MALSGHHAGMFAARCSWCDVAQLLCSWLYMAPEMVSGNKYSEKVDVYAMAVMLYEALNFRLNVMKLALGREPKAISDYADEVSKGHREQIPKSWPVEVRSLLEGAWEQVCCLFDVSGCLHAVCP